MVEAPPRWRVRGALVAGGSARACGGATVLSAPPSGSPSRATLSTASAPLPTLVALAAVLRHFGGV